MNTRHLPIEMNRRLVMLPAPLRIVFAMLAVFIGVTPLKAGPLTAIETKLRPEPISEAGQDDHLGAAIAIDGDWMVIGVPQATQDVASRQGAVDLYQRQPDGTWRRGATVTASDAQRSDRFGAALALAGDTLVVSATRRSTATDKEFVLLYVFARRGSKWIEEATFEPLEGRWERPTLAVHGDRFVCGLEADSDPTGMTRDEAYVFHRGNDGWELEARLTGFPVEQSTGFGRSVALGDEVLLVCAPGETSVPDDVRGVVYAFELVENQWILAERISAPTNSYPWGRFGMSVALHDDLALVGHSSESGGVHVFQRVADRWEHETLLRPEPSNGWLFGFAVAAGDGQAVFSALNDDSDPETKSVFVYTREAGRWTLQARIDSPNDYEDHFADALDVDGASLCVGAPEYDGLSCREQGAAYVYHEDDGAWSPEATLRRADGLLSDDDHFGDSVDVKGDLLVAGAPFDSGEAGPYQGAVYVYRRVGDGWQLREKLVAPDAVPFDLFGTAVAISGDRFIASAMNADSPVADYAGAAYVYRMEADEPVLEARLHAAEGAPGDRFGRSVAISGDLAIVGAHYADEAGSGEAGTAYVFECVDGAWTQQARLVASDPTEDAYFGYAVATDGVRALVGAPYEVADYRGGAYVFSQSSGTWAEQARLVVTDAGSGITFGLAVAIAGDTLAIGAPGVNNPGGNAGRVFIYRRAGGVWERQQSLRADPGSPGAKFGGRLMLQDGRLAIGARAERSDDLWAHGAAYLFHDDNGVWSQALRVVASDTHANQYFSMGGVALTNRDLVVGTPCDGNGTGLMPGAVYTFDVRCPGDLDGDWDSDPSDLIALLSSYGTTSGATRETGDLDGDGDVDLADLAGLLGHYGEACE